MTQKNRLLEEVSELSAREEISEAELQAAFALGKQMKVFGTTPSESLFHRLSIAEVLYYIGGFIVFLGIVILLAQNWESLTTSIKLLVTLGASAVSFSAALLFGRRNETRGLTHPFNLIAVMVLPIGIYQLFVAFGDGEITTGIITIIFAIVSFLYFVAYWFLKKIVFLLFGILSISIFYFLVTNLLIGDSLSSDAQLKFYEYRLLILGLSYLFLGKALDKTAVRGLSGSMYTLGIIGFLAAAYALQGWFPEQSLLWEVVFPLLAFLSMFLSTYVQRKSLLIFGAIGIMAYVIKITGQYFSAGLGWPLALVVAGLAFIGVGYFTYYMNKKYFNKTISSQIS
jgi:hypothetical protein